MSIPKDIKDLILDIRIPGPARLTGLMLQAVGYGTKRCRLTQEELANAFGISRRTLVAHLEQLRLNPNEQNSAHSINTYKGASKPRHKKGQGKQMDRQLRIERAESKVYGFMARCQGEGVDPFACVGAECHGKMQDRIEMHTGAFLCGTPECHILLTAAARQQPLITVHASELEVLRYGEWGRLT